MQAWVAWSWCEKQLQGNTKQHNWTCSRSHRTCCFMIMRNRVDLPAPLPPMMPTQAPGTDVGAAFRIMSNTSQVKVRGDQRNAGYHTTFLRSVQVSARKMPSADTKRHPAIGMELLLTLRRQNPPGGMEKVASSISSRSSKDFFRLSTWQCVDKTCKAYYRLILLRTPYGRTIMRKCPGHTRLTLRPDSRPAPGHPGGGPGGW